MAKIMYLVDPKTMMMHQMTSTNHVHQSIAKLDQPIRVIMEKPDFSEGEKIREVLLHDTATKETVSYRRSKVVCHKCGCFFQWKKSLQRHMETIHADTRYKCSACSFTFNRKDNFARHKKRLHPSHIRMVLEIYNALEQPFVEPPK